MIECTLQEAVKKCKENGGRFKKEGSGQWLVVSNTPAGKIQFEKDRENLDMCVSYFESTWIYEPPQQSAFQKWNKAIGTTYHIDRNRVPYEKQQEADRKRGWNAAIDAVLEQRYFLMCPPDIVKNLSEWTTQYRKEIKELKEG